MSEQTTFDIQQVIAQAKAVITDPRSYFQTMPKTGGFANPVIFVAVMGALAGLVTAIMSLFGTPAGMLIAGLSAIILMPVFAVIGSFISAAILFVIWKLMGSGENYEAAYRCQSSATAIYPVVALVAIIPYVGNLIMISWGAFLMIEASVWVHGRKRSVAQVVFGILAALMILSNVASERAARQMEVHMDQAGHYFEGVEEPAEEARA